MNRHRGVLENSSSMASNNDTSGKNGGKPVVGETPKKPTALIDLKASEVDIRELKQEPAPGAAKAASTVAAAAAKAATGPGVSPSATATTSAAASHGASQRTAASSTGTGANRPSSGAMPPTTSAASGGGLRGAATHLVAGLAGGVLALLGADAVFPKSGAVHDGSVGTAAIEKRLRTLEQSTSARAVSPELALRLAAAEERLGQLDRTAQTINDQQAKLTGATEVLGARLADVPPPGSGADERLAKLEEILALLSTANAGDPQRGRIPQLATITSKLTDLEANLATQLGQLRKGVTAEVESRLSQSTEAALAARTGTQRLDRELAGVKTEAAQINTKLDGINTQSDRLARGLDDLRQQATALKTDVGTVREEMRQVARPADVTTALSPLSSKLSALEENVQGVVRGEDDRRANIERIVMALELGNLKRTIERGAPFASELTEVKRVAGPKSDLAALERFKDRGVPALGDLEREFRDLAFTMIEADRHPENAHWTDRLIASAKSVVRVRKVDQDADDQSAEARVARMEQALKSGRLPDVIGEAAKLSDKAKGAAKAWLAKVEGRAAVDRAIATVEQELKSSLGAQSQSGKKG